MQKSPFRKLAERFDMNLTGMPKKDGDFSPSFLQYLEILFTPEEAEVASFLSAEPKRLTAEEVAEKAGRPVGDVEQVLGRLVEKNAILGFGGQYMLPMTPLLLNIHQFRTAVDQDALKASQLYQDFYIKDGFYRFYESSAQGTPVRRAVPVEQSISDGQHILSHEEVKLFLDEANMGAMALVPCPCRNRTEKMGRRECKDKHGVESCLFLGMPAVLMVGRGEGKQISREEAESYVKEMRELGLVMMTDNAAVMKDGVVCFCCGCCCSITRGLTRWSNSRAFARSNFVARVGDDCALCGTCVDRCMFKAISVPDGAGKLQIDESRCMGCGACTVTCPTEALRLERLEREPIYATQSELRSKIAVENEAAGQKRRLQ
ncbi:4Fe-4S dicluster domain-containing protein [Candidatus Poribacteria bacterium]|nr:4Fe-4S dicluster domain-containing protein [Candidatus Poribacteria bacterium]